jgi:hypothetical protein
LPTSFVHACFGSTAAWPRALSVQLVVDGEPRGAPVDVVVHKRVSRMTTEYRFHSAELLHRARGFGARTVGHQLAAADVVEWRLETPGVSPV